MSLSDNIVKIVQTRLDHLFLRGVFSYVVSSESNGRISLRPETKGWLPDLPLAEVWPGIAGYSVEPKPNAIVLVAFVNADRRRPVCVGFCPRAYTVPNRCTIESDTLTTCLSNRIDLCDAVAPVIRDGDGVVIQDETNQPPTPLITGVIRLTIPGTTYPAKATSGSRVHA